MRITFVLPTVDMGGGCRVLAIYARRLSERGHHVHVVVPPNRKPSWRARAKAVMSGKGRLSFSHISPSHFDVHGFPLHILERRRPVMPADVPDADVIVATLWICAEWIQGFPREKGAPVLFAQGFEIDGSMPPERVRAAWRMPIPKIVVSSWLAGIASREFGDTDVSLVPNGVDLDQFYAEERGKQEYPTAGFVYSTTPCKRSDIIAAAIEEARVSVPDLRVKAFGHQAPIPEVPFPAAAEFTLLPEQSQLRHVYGTCDMWLHASDAEGFGLPILEAMACRTPVISTPAGAAPELLANGGGWLVEHADPDAMADAVVRMAELPDEDWRDMSAAARRTAESYSWAEATDRFEAALTRISR